MSTYTLRDRGADLRVETWTEPDAPQKNHARLLVDDEEVATGATDEIGSVRLGEDAGHLTRVSWWWTGRVASCDLVESGVGEERHRATPYAPPPGTRAARLHAWGEAHPRLWATRHVLAYVASTLLGALALGALLPRISLPNWLPDLPDVDLPAWTRYLDPGYWLAPLFGWVEPVVRWVAGLVPDVELGWLKYVIGLAVAVGLAVREVRRRRRRERP